MYTAPVFEFFYEQPWSFIIPVVVAIFLCKVAYEYFLKQLYLDAGLRQKATEAKTEDLNFLNRFGKISTYLKNEG